MGTKVTGRFVGASTGGGRNVRWLGWLGDRCGALLHACWLWPCSFLPAPTRRRSTSVARRLPCLRAGPSIDSLSGRGCAFGSTARLCIWGGPAPTSVVPPTSPARARRSLSLQRRGREPRGPEDARAASPPLLSRQ